LKELKRDMESVLTSNQAQAVGTSTTARTLGGLGSWIATNDVFGTGGASPTGNGTDSRTDGTQRAFTEAQLKAVIKSAWNEGGAPSAVMVGPFNKQTASSFTGNATRFDKSEDKSLTAAIDVYRSDFGDLTMVPNRFSRDRDAWVIDKSMFAIHYLRPFRQWELNKSGDAEKRQLLVEFTLVSRQEKASGLVADLTTS